MTETAIAPILKDSILDTIGDTPLVRLSRIGAGVRPRLVAKLESFNPGGSIKDRVAVALIDAAERDGHLRPGGTIVEPTSGNTGTGLAIAARLKGYRVIAVMPDKMSREKIDLLRAYGADVVLAPTDVPPDSPQSYYRVADRLTAEIPGAFQPNQYFNQANPQAHYESTGPEIWEQTAGQITHLVAGVGTGGTVSGTARYLRERKPELVVVGADPEGSIYSGGPENVRPYLVEGVGEDFWPETFDPTLIDRWVTVSDRDAFLTTRRLAQLEGILAGGSGGLALHAALQVAAEVEDPDALIVVILPDGGRSYLSKIYSERGCASTASSSAIPRCSSATCSRASAMPARSRRWSRSRPTSASATRSRSCTSTASRSCRSSAPTIRRPWSARSASAGCWGAPPRTPRSSTRRSSR